MITLIDRSRVTLRDGTLSESTLTDIENTLAVGKNILIYLNRRGAHRALVCNDCSYVVLCPHCDISCTLHTSPKKELLCHHCGYKTPVPETCPKCGGANLKGVGIAIQAVETFCAKVFSANQIVRLDSDASKLPKKSESISLEGGTLYLATAYALRYLSAPIHLCVVLTPETELAVPEYDIEERLYTSIRALSGLASEMIIETHTPKLALIQDILHGNYRDFLTRTLRDRKVYRYPPYTGLAYIEISHKSLSTVEDIAAKLTNKLGLESSVTGSQISYDRKARMRRGDMTVDTLVVR